MIGFYPRTIEIMDDIHDFDIIYVELDAYFKKKQVSRCKDEFLSILCEEDDYEAIGNDAQTGITKEESDEDYLEGSNEEDSDEEFEYSTHNPKVKWNKMRPTLGERYESPHELKGFQIHFKKCDSIRLVAICGSDPKKCPFVVRASWMSTEKFVLPRSCYAVPSGVNEYEVRNEFQNYRTELKEKSCACRLWEISGLLCVHA
uniref:SWIM-type domain-containing protein n=1 Tax=Lactuca sativa TaxID=4236 RepID=A0A9R1XJX1_LACSA|nr:hypothetical protein LSAT_V11C300146410 [Lactuca sativa]